LIGNMMESCMFILSCLVLSCVFVLPSPGALLGRIRVAPTGQPKWLKP
jgi:hypothetical protein